MSGIYGYVTDKNIRGGLKGSLMKHSERDVISEVTDSRAMCGCVSNSFYDNSVVKSGDFIISFYGEIFGVLGDGTYAEKDVVVKNAAGLCKLIEDMQRESGDDDNVPGILDSVIHLLNGAFIISCYDCKTGEIVIYNDRFGLYPLFWSKTDDGFFYSQEAKVFKDIINLKPDYTGIAEYLSFDYCIEDRTLFKNVKYMLPAQRVCYKDGNVYTDIYWEMPADPGKAKTGKRGYVSELHNIYEKAVRVRASEKADIIGLTGGFDSRLILAILGGEKAHTYNFGNKGSGDQVGASALANEYKTDHHYMDFAGMDYMQDVRDIVWITDGQCPFERFYVLESARAKAKIGGGIEISGMGGDAISGQKSNFTGLIPLMNLRMIEVRRKDIGKKTFSAAQRGRISADNKNIYGDVITTKWQEVIADYDKAEGYADKAVTFGNYTMRLKMRSLERRVTMSSMWLIGQYLPIRFPVYDYRVVDFFNTVPQKYRFGQRLYIRMIQEYYPRAAKCPHSETGRPARESHAVLVDFVTVWGFVRSKLGLKKKGYNNSFGFVNDELIKNIDNGNINKLLQSQKVSENGIFNLSAFGGRPEDIIDKAKSGDGTALTVLKNVIHFSIMNELFFDGNLDIFYGKNA